MRRILLSILTVLSLTAAAEEIGKWTLYQSYYNITQVESAGTDVFALASGSLYSLHLSDNSLTTYYKDNVLSSLDGGCLSSSGIERIAWCEMAKRLIVAYENNKIDLLTADKDVRTFTDLADKQMTGDKTIYNICVFGQHAYICTGFGIMKFDVVEEYVVDTYNLGIKVNDAFVNSTYIYALTEKGVKRAPLSSNLLNKDSWTDSGEDWSTLKPSKNLSNAFGTLFHDNKNNCYWGNDSEGKLARYEEDEYGTMQQTSSGVVPDGPLSNRFWRLYLHDNRLFGTCGNFSYGFSLKDFPGCVQTYDGNSWSKLADPGKMTGYDYVHANCMAFDPLDKNHFWVGAGSGLYEYRDYIPVKAYNSGNSALSGVSDVELHRSAVCSMTYDRDNNLWAMNGWSSIPVVRFSRDGNSQSFPQQGISMSTEYNVDAQSAFVSPTNGYLWWNNNQWGKHVVYRYDWRNNSLTWFNNFVNEDGTTIACNLIFDLTEDKEGNIWVASDGGPFYITRADAAGSDGDIWFIQHKVPRNDGTNYADYLLAGVSIRTIAVDAANRKWMGSSGAGVYLISSDNNTEIHHFTTENSPILSDIIYDIIIDDETGTVYFATPNGLCTYQGDVSSANAEGMAKETVWAYPNPVTPEHTGMITVVGLTPGAQVKILTASGQLVNEGTCSGGSYQWDGCDMKGRKVASGIYMVNAATPEGEKGIVTKIAIVR
ncbi:hypothetical protein E5358_00125 [Palleniella muris]|uniref:Uncharacterized protein n=1 Tax=Palleniella muris TaxID=3038145 RepID=A0AC61QTT2_9BACT|nr:two-component regulator propeller domain-containing protein [Palleniella muris]TGX84083.1 hypothetical protein E5358_00125 [Palleniella muris]